MEGFRKASKCVTGAARRLKKAFARVLCMKPSLTSDEFHLSDSMFPARRYQRRNRSYYGSGRYAQVASHDEVHEIFGNYNPFDDDWDLHRAAPQHGEYKSGQLMPIPPKSAALREQDRLQRWERAPL